LGRPRNGQVRPCKEGIDRRGEEEAVVRVQETWISSKELKLEA